MAVRIVTVQLSFPACSSSVLLHSAVFWLRTWIDKSSTVFQHVIYFATRGTSANSPA